MKREPTKHKEKLLFIRTAVSDLLLSLMHVRISTTMTYLEDFSHNLRRSNNNNYNTEKYLVNQPCNYDHDREKLLKECESLIMKANIQIDIVLF